MLYFSTHTDTHTKMGETIDVLIYYYVPNSVWHIVGPQEYVLSKPITSANI